MWTCNPVRAMKKVSPCSMKNMKRKTSLLLPRIYIAYLSVTHSTISLDPTTFMRTESTGNKNRMRKYNKQYDEKWKCK